MYLCLRVDSPKPHLRVKDGVGKVRGMGHAAPAPNHRCWTVSAPANTNATSIHHVQHLRQRHLRLYWLTRWRRKVARLPRWHRWRQYPRRSRRCGCHTGVGASWICVVQTRSSSTCNTLDHKARGTCKGTESILNPHLIQLLSQSQRHLQKCTESTLNPRLIHKARGTC